MGFISKSDSGPVKLPGLSRNEPQASTRNFLSLAPVAYFPALGTNCLVLASFALSILRLS